MLLICSKVAIIYLWFHLALSRIEIFYEFEVVRMGMRFHFATYLDKYHFHFKQLFNFLFCLDFQ